MNMDTQLGLIVIKIGIGGRGMREFEDTIDGISIMNSVDDIMEAYQLTQRRLFKGVQ